MHLPSWIQLSGVTPGPIPATVLPTFIHFAFHAAARADSSSKQMFGPDDVSTPTIAVAPPSTPSLTAFDGQSTKLLAYQVSGL